MKNRNVIMLIAIMLLSVTTAFGQWNIDEGFEGGIIPADWTIYDVDGDGEEWVAYENNSAAHSGNWMAKVECSGSGGHDWLITPQVAILSGDSFIFFARAWYSTEDFNVKLSTTGNAINDFNVTLESIVGAGDEYVEYSYDLSSYAGSNIYLGIEWFQDAYALVVDDVKVGQAEANDAGMVSIEVPEAYHYLNSEVYPSGTIMNYGTSNITEDFDIICEIVDESSVVVYSSTVVYSGTIVPGATEVVDFSDVWQPTEVGDYTVTMTTYLTGDANPNNDSFSIETEIFQHYGTGGPDAFGYQWIDSTEPGGPVYDWIEISETGTSTITYGVPGFYGDDNFSEPIEFGFDFPFYGIDRTYFHVDINGEFLLTDNTWYHSYPDPYGIWQTDGNMFNYVYPIPGYTQMPALIAVYWDDLHADEGTGDIFFQTFGTAPNRYCVVEWHNVRFHNGTGGTPCLCFEVIFHESGEMIFQYQNVATGQTGQVCPQDYGQSSTIAIQNDTADIGLCYLREIVENGQYIGIEPHGNMLQNELAISFFMGEDYQPPAFMYDEVGNTFDNTPEISLTITDMHPILSDTLYYNIGSGWEGISHTNFVEPNIYYYQLPEIPNSTTVNYYFAATDDSPAQNRGTLPVNAPQEFYTFKILPTDGVEVLLAFSGDQDYQNLEYPKYIMALDNANVAYDIYDWEEYDYYAFPDCYEAIFAYGKSFGHGDEEDTFSAAMMDFLDYGTNDDPKNLFMAADDIANNAYSLYSFNLYDRPLTKFYYAYLRGDHIPTGYGGGTDGIGGPDIYDYSDGSALITDESVIGSANQELPTYSNSPDVLDVRACPTVYQNEVLNPEISSISAFIFEDGPFNGQAYAYHNTCALSLDNLIYKSFFTSFDLSQFTNNNDINMIIGDAVEWF
ncbi:MAG: choice-of-anchor J domain-containing protein, partial [Candidatus Cloacimonetes bacterium]|nr:choice-of-anchor J domain-containing protein [Candidatus Cloacimonadota bacterium]